MWAYYQESKDLIGKKRKAYYRANQEETLKKRQVETRCCAYCGKEFNLHDGRRIYCSEDCAKKAIIERRKLGHSKRAYKCIQDFGDCFHCGYEDCIH